MKRYHYNMTSEVVTCRTWALLVDVDESDFLWLKAFNIPIRVDKPSHEFLDMSGKKQVIYGKPIYTLDTTTDKQRNMLMLKFGDSAVLIQEDVILPNSLGMCTLSELKI